MRPTLRRELGIGPERRIVGLLPGSRAQEVRHHAPVMERAGARLWRASGPTCAS